MYVVTIPPMELFINEEFRYESGRSFKIEHSLLSISKWEEKWHKPFLSDDKTSEEMLDYIKCMTIDKDVEDFWYYRIPESEIINIRNYMDDSHTATWFKEDNDPNAKNRPSKNTEVVTNELIYYWMSAFNLPFTVCEKWHINKLLTLLRVCNIKNQPPKKMSQKEVAKQYKALNDARRKKFGSKG